MRALVIGADGFVGQWLIRHLLESGDSVDALVGPRSSSTLSGVGRADSVDVRDAGAIGRFVAEARPELIYYLAGVSQRGARDSLDAAAGVSVIGCLNTLIAAAALPEPARLLYPSTGYVYAGSHDPLTEDAPVRPGGLYAAAKLAAEQTMLILGPLAGVEILVARAFNHVGPRQSESFLVPAVARQVAEAAAGRRSVVKLGSSSQIRDFCDVRDVVRAYRIMATRGVANSIYNVASGTGTSIDQLVRMLVEIAGVSPTIESSAGPNDGEQPAVLIGNATRLRDLGWEPEYQLETTLAEVLAEHASALASGDVAGRQETEPG